MFTNNGHANREASMPSTQARSDQAQPAHVHLMYQVCWQSVVGEGIGRERPVPRNVAEFMVRDEALANPLRRFWVYLYEPKDESGRRSVHVS
jgi:hypothetical protein